MMTGKDDSIDVVKSHIENRVKNKKILLVDDSLLTSRIVSEFLNENGYETETVTTGEEALQKVCNITIDLILMDIELAGEMDGIEALREIKQINPKAKVIMISAMGQEKSVKESIVAGASGFILKPFNEEQVIRGLSKFK
ncbi:Chemotaxis protein CheY [bioreactor metagenome]|uniref:Chemotaxis protein CheY n=1 Tax=bioreactor metagenome TaxID=1076179 RepID=A0A645CEF7_9ZZZZ